MSEKVARAEEDARPVADAGEERAGEERANEERANEERAEKERADKESRTRRRRRRPTAAARGRRRSQVAGWAVLGLAVVFCGWSGWTYWQGTHDDSVAFAHARDDVRRAARQEIATLNTIDGRSADAGLRRWLDASTGPLNAELKRDMPQSRQKIQQARTVAAGTVTDLAVTDLDNRAGTAQVIATVDVRITPASGAASTQRKRFSAVLARTGRAWKLKSLTAMPAGGG